MLPYVLAGVACVLAASFVAQRTRLGRSLTLDLKGERARGLVERRDDGVYMLRFQHPSGTIYRRRYEGGFGFQSVQGRVSEITLAYDPDQPTTFQPVGLSYLPGTAAGLLFLAGMGFVLYSRRVAILMRRRGNTTYKQCASKEI
jgi:hypothetical protein